MKTEKKIINLTQHEISMFDMDDLVPGERRRGYYVRAGTEPVEIYPSQGVARATCVEETVGRINGSDVVKRVYGGPQNLPEPKDGVYYIVTALVANAARQAGRSVHDLLLTARQVKDMQNNVVGYAAFGRL